MCHEENIDQYPDLLTTAHHDRLFTEPMGHLRENGLMVMNTGSSSRYFARNIFPYLCLWHGQRSGYSQGQHLRPWDRPNRCHGDSQYYRPGYIHRERRLLAGHLPGVSRPEALLISTYNNRETSGTEDELPGTIPVSYRTLIPSSRYLMRG